MQSLNQAYKTRTSYKSFWHAIQVSGVFVIVKINNTLDLRPSIPVTKVIAFNVAGCDKTASEVAEMCRLCQRAVRNGCRSAVYPRKFSKRKQRNGNTRVFFRMQHSRRCTAYYDVRIVFVCLTVKQIFAFEF